MRIIGHGIDLTPVDRVERLLAEHGERFLARCFTDGERAYADGRKKAAEHYAARFAAKEAALKALGTGWTGGIAWTDVEVVSTPSGAPQLRLSGIAQHTAQSLGITAWSLSLSHAGGLAAASVIATGP